MNILIHRTLPVEAVASFRKQFLEHDIRVVPSGKSISAQWQWMEVLLGNPNPTDVKEKGRSLRWIQLLSSGIDGYEDLAESGIRMTTAHGIHAPVIAQHILMTLLMMERKQPLFYKRQKEAVWDRQARLPGLLRNKRISLFGYGAIGRELVRLLSPMQVEIHAVAMTIPEGRPDYPNVRIYGPAETETVIALANHLVLALPLTPKTRNFLSRSRLRHVKSGACLHNVGRGELVDQGAIVEMLESGRLAGAALDVFEKEPLPVSSPLWTMENCIITPHIAGHHSGLDLDILNLFIRNLKQFDAGMPLLNEANFNRGY